SGVISLAILDDHLQELNETLIITLGTPTNATLGAIPQLTITIQEHEFGLIAVAPDVGGPPEVKVYDVRTGALKLDFYAYDGSFTGGVRVAVADLNNDGYPDIITGTGPGTAPEVRAFDGRTSAMILDFYAYSPVFTGGIFVAAGDLNGDNIPD